MAQEGLMAGSNPSALLISNESAGLSGHAIGATVEGIRPMLIEVQALVSSAVYGTSQRISTGFDNKRLNMLLAVLEKRRFSTGRQRCIFKPRGRYPPRRSGLRSCRDGSDFIQ